MFMGSPLCFRDHELSLFIGGSSRPQHAEKETESIQITPIEDVDVCCNFDICMILSVTIVIDLLAEGDVLAETLASLCKYLFTYIISNSGSFLISAECSCSEMARAATTIAPQ